MTEHEEMIDVLKRIAVTLEHIAKHYERENEGIALDRWMKENDD